MAGGCNRCPLSSLSLSSLSLSSLSLSLLSYRLPCLSLSSPIIFSPSLLSLSLLSLSHVPLFSLSLSSHLLSLSSPLSSHMAGGRNSSRCSMVGAVMAALEPNAVPTEWLAQPSARLPLCRHPFVLPIETPARGREGRSRMTGSPPVQDRADGVRRARDGAGRPGDFTAATSPCGTPAAAVRLAAVPPYSCNPCGEPVPQL